MTAMTAPFDGVPTALKRPLLALVLLQVAIVLLYWDTAAAMVGIWARSDTFAHGFLVPPISLWLIWRGRDRLVGLQPKPSLPWLIPMALAAGAWLLGDLVGVNGLTQFALVALIVLAVPLALGWTATRAMLFPLLFLFFCVPVGEFLLPLLMERTADFTVMALRLSGIPVFREGLQFVIPSGNWSVVEACSGVRYLIASLMVGSLFAYLNYQSLSRRLVFVGVSIVVPIVANWLRAYMIVMLGHLSNNRIATGVDHLVYGWVFFGVVIMIMFMIGSRWSEPDRVPVPRPAAAFGLSVPAFPTPLHMVALCAALVIAALPHAAERTLQGQLSKAPVQMGAPIGGQAGWSAMAEPADWQPKFYGAVAQQHTLYRRGDQVVGVYVGYYRDQGPERKAVSSVNVLVSSENPVWNPIGVSRIEVTTNGAALPWRATHLLGKTGGLTSTRRHRTAWQSYWIDDRFTDGDVQAKLYGAVGLLAGRGDDAAIVVLHTELPPEEGGTRLLTEFSQTHMPSLREALRQVRAAR